MYEWRHSWPNKNCIDIVFVHKRFDSYFAILMALEMHFIGNKFNEILNLSEKNNFQFFVSFEFGKKISEKSIFRNMKKKLQII